MSLKDCGATWGGGAEGNTRTKMMKLWSEVAVCEHAHQRYNLVVNSSCCAQRAALLEVGGIGCCAGIAMNAASSNKTNCSHECIY
jgi:hypothetical protein